MSSGNLAYPTGQFLDQYTSEMQGYTFRNQVNFNRTFRRHDFNVVLGTELRHLPDNFLYPLPGYTATMTRR